MFQGVSRIFVRVKEQIGMAPATENGRKRGGTAASLLLAVTVSALALPGAVLAFSSGLGAQVELASDSKAGPGEFLPATIDPRLARSISVRALNKGVFKFTPAGLSARPDRLVTVAVRMDPGSNRAGSAGRKLAISDGSDQASSRIAPMAYNLGVSRGYRNFAQSPVTVGDLRKIDMPDLATFKPGTAARRDPSRFGARIELDEKQNAGRAPRTFEGQDEARVDVGGSYRLTRNLNVTAGVRYEQERDRLVPLTDGRQDSQAVYVGTQFHF